MRTGRPMPALTLSVEEREALERWRRRPKTAQALARRAEVVLGAAAGKTNTALARELRCTSQTVGRWRGRFLERRLDGLLDEPRRGAPRRIGDADVERVLTLTLETAPADATHWSTRAMAQRAGLSQSAVSRIWRAFALAPHRVEHFQLSKDPLFIEKVRDIVGLYLCPPERALVLCVDEKTQIQALDRTQPMLPLRPGQAERRTHDYARHGVTSLFAALEVGSGQVVGACYARHRHQEFLAFLRRIVREFPGTELHLVLDNSSTHSTPEVRRWLRRHPRLQFHFTPTGASWMNMVETWFSILTRRQVRRGSYGSGSDLISAIQRFIDHYNQHAGAFVWTKTSEQILAKAIKPQDTSETEH